MQQFRRVVRLMGEIIHKPKRLPQLDILRAIACILVIISHSPPVPGNPLMQALARGGWIGVDLFFVLSGFLVTSLLFQEYLRDGRVRAGRFAIRRALKIYPTFYLFLFATTSAIALLANDLSNISPAKIFAEVFFVQNYFPSVWGHTWSLAVEEHFYITVIGLVWVSSRFGAGNPFRCWPPVIVIVCLATLGLRVALAHVLSEVPHATHLRCDALSAGILLAYIWNFHQHWFIQASRSYRTFLLVLGGVLVTLPFVYHWREHSWIRIYGLTTNYLGSALILFAVIPLRMNTPGVLCRSLAWIGTYSYSIYVWHAVVANWVNPRLYGHAAQIHNHLPWIVSVVLSLTLGIILAHIVEFPVLRFRDRLFPSTERQAPDASG